MTTSPDIMSCLDVDNTFGPHAGSCRGGFDFTLLFEETILTLLPLSLCLLVALPRVWYLTRRAQKVDHAGRYGALKAAAWLALAAVELTAVVLWGTVPAQTRTQASLAAAVVTLLAVLALGLLSYFEHIRAVRPSSLLGAYLFVTLLFDITHTRTLWLRSHPRSLADVSAAAIAVKVLVLIVEALPKRASLLRPEYQDYPPEATSGLYNRFFFWWLNPLFLRGYRDVLSVDDLFTLDKHLKAGYLHVRFQTAWTAISGKSKSAYSLLLTSFGVLRWSLLQTLPARAALTALNFCQPFLINSAIRLSETAVDDVSAQTGYGLIGGYILVYVGIAVATGQYQHRTYRTITMVRGGLIAMLYRKTGSLSLKDLDPAASMTLMSADIERIVQGWQTMHEIWANAAEVAIAIFLLQQQLGVACVVPVAVSVLSLLGSLVAMSSIMARQGEWLEAIEKRISATSAMLSSMKGVKMCGLKDTLMASLQQLRIDELRISRKFRRLIIWNLLFAYVTQIFAPVFTFLVFSLRARAVDDKSLDTGTIFTSLSLFALLSEPLASLVMSLATFMGAVGSFTRIQEFLDAEERVDKRQRPEAITSTEKTSTDALAVQAADFAWDAAKQPLLKSLQMSIPVRQLTMIVGPVGCGKSTLLHALLGEIPALAGTVKLFSTSVSYVSQSPWHMNGTIRDAIIASEPVDEDWYNRVVRLCALRIDFQQLPQGDATPIGSGGIALSGGQSKRIALARAIYARREIILLDDVFSGLDTTTEDQVFHGLMGERGLLRELRSTVVLVSSSAKYLPYADHIVCLGPNGAVTEAGAFADLKHAGGYVSSFSLPTAEWALAGEDDGASTLASERGDEDVVSADSSQTAGEGALVLTPSKSVALASEMEMSAGRATGDVQIYLYYIQSVGWWASLIFVVAIMGFAFCISFPSWWAKEWAAYNADHPNDRLGYWLGVYASLGVLAIVCLFISCWQMIMTMVPRSGENFHFLLLKTVLSAPMSFFVKTDSGVTINRFSQDLQLIDMELPISALNTFATLVMVLAQMILIGVGSPFAAISFPIVLVALFFIQKVYLRTSRQLRLLDLEAKAPLYSLFEESLTGLATIRAFGWQKALEAKNALLLDRSQRPFYLLFSVQRWLTLVLDMLVAAVAVLLIALVVALRGTINAGGVGLALLNVIQFSQSIKLLITFWTTLETHIGSVARIKEFTGTTVAEDTPDESGTPPPNWPAQGAVEFENLSASYNAGDLVLSNVSLSIRPGEKIAICGRTGSGKTSLITTLFRLLDLQGGAIRVDGIDLATLPRQEVRRRIVGVPQHPFLLKGTVRLNADPMGEASDEAIHAALQSVQVHHLVAEQGGLDADIDSLNLSSGQRQLFCLARAMLRPSTILVLDEVTSSIDAKTEEIIQRSIRKRFASHTIIAVTHKLESIMDFDRVAVLDAGRLVEFENPYVLLETPGSAFAKLHSAALVDEELEDEGMDKAKQKEQ